MTDSDFLVFVQCNEWEYSWADFFDVPYVRIDSNRASNLQSTVISADLSEPHTLRPYISGLHREKTISACITFQDIGRAVAVDLTQHFDIPWRQCTQPELIFDKLSMREQLKKNGLGTVEFAEVNNPSDVDRFVKKHGRSILKPAIGTGSQGIEKIQSEGDAQEFKNLDTVRCIVESFIEGREFSIEAFSIDGEHHLLGITDKVINPETFHEKMHIFPAQLKPGNEQAIWNSVARDLTALGIQNGPSHTEVIANGQGIHIVETHCRPGGAGIPGLVEWVTGFCIARETIALAIGHQVSLPATEEKSGCAIMHFLDASDGQVNFIGGVAAANWVSGVKEAVIYPRIGDHVTATTSNLSRLGHIVAVGESLEKCMQSVREAVARINVEIVPSGSPSRKDGS